MSAPTTTTEAVGPLVRLQVLTPASLPAHPDLAAQQQTSPTSPSPEQFASSILTEADTFLTKYIRQHSTVKTAAKPSSPSTAPVQLSTCKVPAAALPHTKTPPTTTTDDEFWAVRTSKHANSATPGSASYTEFKKALMSDHGRREAEYTPDIYDAHHVLSYNLGAVTGWAEVEMSILEMAHELPFPLHNRCFAVLVVGGSVAGDDGLERFVDVQIPVDLTGVVKSMYSTGRNRVDGDEAVKRKDVVFGKYVSVERCELLDDGANVLWEMGTCSDAGGVLPAYIQRMAIGPAIAKDVGFVVDWADKRRTGRIE